MNLWLDVLEFSIELLNLSELQYIIIYSFLRNMDMMSLIVSLSNFL